jgi:hypothetical protein
MFAFFLGVMSGIAFLYFRKEINVLRAENAQLRFVLEEHLLDMYGHTQATIQERMEDMKR